MIGIIKKQIIEYMEFMGSFPYGILKELKKDILFSIKVLIGCAVILAILPTVTTAAAPTVIMTFDDGWSSVSEKAFSVMQNNGQPGVAFIYPEAIQGKWPDYMSVLQLNNLTDAGWDISSHSYTHPAGGLINVSATNLTTELNLSKAWLDAHAYSGSMFLAYPEGTYNDAVITAVKTRYVAARTVNTSGINVTGFPTCTLSGPTFTSTCTYTGGVTTTLSGINPYDVTTTASSDLAYKLPSYEIMGGQSTDAEDFTSVEAIKTQINNTFTLSGTLILTFHKIIDASSINLSEPTEYSTEDFTLISNYLKEKSIEVVTLSSYFGQAIPTSLIPPTVSYSNGTDWINVSYELGLRADGEAILMVNGTQNQTSILKASFFNITSLPKHTTLNLSVIGRKNSTAPNTTSESKVIQTLNSPVLIDWNASTQKKGNENETGVWNGTQIYAGENFSITVISTDPDGDKITYTTNSTKATITSLNDTTAVFTLNNTIAADIGSYNWSITANDNYGSSVSINFNLVIVKPVQTLSLSSTKGNFWVNWSFIPGGLKSDYIAVFINGTEVQNGTATFYNTMTNGSLSPHSTVNISVLSHNNSFGDLGSVWSNDTQTFDNNRVCISGPCLYDLSTDSWTLWQEYQVSTGITLTILPKVENLDNDPLVYELILTNKTENTTVDYSINNSTGYITITNTSYLGFFNFTINLKDNYGSSDSVNFTVYIVEHPINSVSGWSGSGGGGGGGADVFDPNTELYERRDSQIRKDIESKVEFVNNNLISNITFHGRRNYGEVIVKASILKGNPTPKYIANAYKFFAIKLDTIREQEENQFISNTTVTVHVEKTKLSDNTLEAYRFKNDTWLPVLVEELPIEDGVSKYYNLESDGLSNFVLVLEPKSSTNIGSEESKLSTMAIIPQIETSPSQMISKIQESLYRVIINWIKKYMWWI